MGVIKNTAVVTREGAPDRIGIRIMAHQRSRSAYDRLSDRLNRFPQGAPPSDLLFNILKISNFRLGFCV